MSTFLILVRFRAAKCDVHPIGWRHSMRRRCRRGYSFRGSACLPRECRWLSACTCSCTASGFSI